MDLQSWAATLFLGVWGYMGWRAIKKELGGHEKVEPLVVEPEEELKVEEPKKEAKPKGDPWLALGPEVFDWRYVPPYTETAVESALEYTTTAHQMMLYALNHGATVDFCGRKNVSLGEIHRIVRTFYFGLDRKSGGGILH